MKQFFTMMIGLSGSGKSYRAKHIKEKRPLIYNTVSSDSIREEKFGDVSDQSHNEEVFNIMREKTIKLLSEGKSVIYDATNLTIKDRKVILEEVKKLKKTNKQLVRQAYVMRTPFLECMKNNFLRDRTIPIEAIKKQRARFQLPLLREGFDDIILDKYIVKFRDIDSFIANFNEQKQHEVFKYFQEQMKDFDQQTHYHKYDLLTHAQKTYQYYCERRGAFVEVCSEYGVLLHDYGKLFTKTLKDNGECAYYNHANVGAYELLSCLDFFSCGNVSSDLQFLYLVNYHMLMFDLEKASEKTIEKYKDLFGSHVWIELEWLHECDKKASGFQEEEGENNNGVIF